MRTKERFSLKLMKNKKVAYEQRALLLGRRGNTSLSSHKHILEPQSRSYSYKNPTKGYAFAINSRKIIVVKCSHVKVFEKTLDFITERMTKKGILLFIRICTKLKKKTVFL